jgi:hypothetical protein
LKYRRPFITPFYLLFILLAALALACSNATEVLERAGQGDNWTDVSELERSAVVAEEVAADQPPPNATEDRKPPASSQSGRTASTPVATVASTPTVANIPTAVSGPQATALELLSHGFRQTDDILSYAFLITNPNQELALEGTPYEVTAYGDGEATIATSSGYLNIIMPQQTTGYANTLQLEENEVVTSIEIQLGEGRTTVSEPLTPFPVERIRAFSKAPVPSLTAIISNPHQSLVNDIRLSAILFDENDQISGGGFAFTSFIPAGGTTGLRMFVDGLPEVLSNGGRVEVFPLLSSLSMARVSETPAGATAATLLQSGYSSSGREVGYGLLIANANTDYDIEGVRYRATAYAADGSVLGINAGYAPRLPSAQTMGLSDSIFVAAEEPVERVDVQISNGRFVQPDPDYQPFVTEDASFEPGRVSNHVRGFVVNPYEQDVTDLFVSAILYDDTGEIIGSGFTFLDEVAARGRTAVEVRTLTSSEPASFELYATLSSLSEFR